jgi:2-polyprenyl-6-methoxyphenol hydroxylase-like FAD-dependent oxidoreductase
LAHFWQTSGDLSARANNMRDMPDAIRDWTVCTACGGEGKTRQPLPRKARLRYQQRRDAGDVVVLPLGQWEPCAACDARGLRAVVPPQQQRLEAETKKTDTGAPASRMTHTTFSSSPRIAVIGGGIGGLALAAAARHRGLHCTVYERDTHLGARAQGYGLTLQQATKALRRLGILDLPGGMTSTKHVVHTQNGKVVGEWGLRKWGRREDKKDPKRQNIHIARQALRYQLWQAAGDDMMRWNHRLQSFTETEKGIDLSFQVGDETVTAHADIVVGADGIRSRVRQQLLGDEKTPLRYLDCIVILGICPLAGLPESPLLDGETVFQTADGTTRMYAMPYSSFELMWQLSFPMEEADACALSQLGATALRDEAWQRCHAWHSPIADMLKATPVELVSGYPVYDRALLEASALRISDRMTLLGDACHCMSPFKGQGANQALLDALSLAGSLYKASIGTLDGGFGAALAAFEGEMLARSAGKVKASADAAKFLHTSVAIQEGNVTRGAASRNNAEANTKL